MKKTVFTILMAMIMVACANKASQQTEFKMYETDLNATSPDSIPAYMTLRIATPVGEGLNKEKMCGALKQIIERSQIAEAIGIPEGETLQEVADRYIVRFREGIEEGELPALCTYDLGIVCQYQNEKAVVFNVTDGIFGNGGPGNYFCTVRLKDGRVMGTNEIATITKADIKQLLKQMGDEDGLQAAEIMDDEGFWVAPDSAGSSILIQTGSHSFYEFNVPVMLLEPYLTDEGKDVFCMGGNTTSPPSNDDEGKE